MVPDTRKEDAVPLFLLSGAILQTGGPDAPRSSQGASQSQQEKAVGPRLVHYIRVAPFAGAVYLSVDRVTLARFMVLMAGLLLFAVPIRCPRCGKRVEKRAPQKNPARFRAGGNAGMSCGFLVLGPPGGGLSGEARKGPG